MTTTNESPRSTMADSATTLSFKDQQNKWDSREDAEGVATTIESASYVETLELKGNTLGVAAGERIAEAIQRHPELKRALWSDLFTGRLKTEIPPVMKSLCDAMIAGGVRLVELDLSDNAFGPIGADGIEKFLQSPAAYSLQVLKLNNNGLGAGGKVIAKSLKQCCLNAKQDGCCFRLKTFIAGRNRLEVAGAMALAEAFQEMSALEEVALPQNGIHARGIEALANSFRYNPHLRIINLSDNTFTALGAHAIAKVLPSLNYVETLDFGDCLCRNKGVDALIGSLDPVKHPSLKTIDLSGNELNANTVEKVLQKLKIFHLDSIHLGTNNLGSRFDDLKTRWQNSAFVDLGKESDNEGTLDGDDEDELNSDAGGSGYESHDEKTERETDGNHRDHARVSASKEYDTAVERVDTKDLNDNEGTLDGDDEDELNSDAGGSGYESHDEKTERETDGNHRDHGDVLSLNLEACTVGDKEAIVSFLDQQHKWNSREDVEEIAKTIESCACVEALELRGNTLGVAAGQRIAQAIHRHPELKRALWSDLFTGRLRSEIPPILKSLCDAMITSGVQLVELDLSDNAFGPVGAEGIQEFLESPAAYSLQVLKLNNNGLGAGGKVIAKSLKQCCLNAKRDGRCFRLKTFIAGRNRLEVPGAIALADAFQVIGTLEEVVMHQNGIKAKGIEAIAASFKKNPKLRVINLSDNTFTAAGARAMAKVIGTLEEVVMHQNGIKAKGIEAIAASFKKNPKLRVINLSDNTFTAAGARAMAKVLPSLRLIEVLNFGDCLCRNDGAIAIVSSLSSCVHFRIKEVNLSGNELSAETVEKIVRAFETAFRLQSLILHTNNLGHRFAELKQYTVKKNFIDLGEESDDQGSLDGGKDAETDSEEESGNEGDDENTEDTEREPMKILSPKTLNRPVTEDDMISFTRRPTMTLLNTFVCQQKSVVEMLRKGLEGRTQEETAAFLYSLAALAGEHTADAQLLERVVILADAILKAAEQRRRWPLSASEQICNLLLAYAGAVKSENGEPFAADVRGLIFLFEAMIRKGHFVGMIPAIKFYFDGSIRKRHPNYGVFIDQFICSL
ncbi:Ran GTPase-activating protein 2 [Toxocara canis]|uniref:Ran GTPase-activating protein 2 n=1 Tax=Toxocara canis TaxID=6265 RepID=A0A0B2UZX7_TOXCA|nr:Ran GTPase-activating protein 2 [Toxocara canis]